MNGDQLKKWSAYFHLFVIAKGDRWRLRRFGHWDGLFRRPGKNMVGVSTNLPLLLPLLLRS